MADLSKCLGCSEWFRTETLSPSHLCSDCNVKRAGTPPTKPPGPRTLRPCVSCNADVPQGADAEALAMHRRSCELTREWTPSQPAPVAWRVMGSDGVNGIYHHPGAAEAAVRNHDKEFAETAPHRIEPLYREPPSPGPAAQERGEVVSERWEMRWEIRRDPIAGDRGLVETWPSRTAAQLAITEIRALYPDRTYRLVRVTVRRIRRPGSGPGSGSGSGVAT